MIVQSNHQVQGKVSPFPGIGAERENGKLSIASWPSATFGLADLGDLGVIVRTNGEHLLLLRPDVCTKCLELRYAPLLAPSGQILPINPGSLLCVERTPWLTPFAREHAVVLAERLAETNADDTPCGYGIHLPSLVTYRFELEPHSSCPVCASPIQDTFDSAVIRLESRPRKDLQSYRISGIGESGINFAKYVNPTCGMFGNAIARHRNHAYNAQAVGFFGDPAAKSAPISWSGHKASFQSSAMVALFEAFERHAGLMPRAKRSNVYDTYTNLRNQAIDPREIGLYDKSFYANQHEFVPFTEDLPLAWVWGYSLTERRPILVPYQFAYYGRDPRGGPKIVADTSNGCASGSCLEEAIFYGLLELIERDAFVILWHARLAPNKLDPDTVREPELYFLIQRLRRAGLAIYLLDTRLDIPVPSVVAVVVRHDRELGTFGLAAGCSFDPETAIASALGEVASYQVGFNDRVAYTEKRLRPAIKDLSLVKTMEDHSLLYGFPEALPFAEFLLSNPTERSIDEAYRDWNSGIPRTCDVLAEITYCLQLLKQAGLEQVVVVDQSSPEEMRLGLRTVRVIVPGLMPLDFGFGRCRAATLPRMYSVPVNLGFRAMPFTQSDLYYVPHPFP
jgi:ribosomal protein S12 methylthiotransferase accessory factor